MRHLLCFFLFFGQFIVAQAQIQTHTIDELLNKAQQESEFLGAASKNIEALQAEISSRDLVLSPRVRGEAYSLKDLRDQLTFARRIRTKLADVTFESPFSTGTLFTLNTGHEDATIEGRGPTSIARWDARITQSLWRDAFGRGTQARRASDTSELHSRRAGILYDRQLIFVDIESIYWDLAAAIREEQVQLKNLEHGKRLLTWTRQRLQRSAAERSDVLQAEALSSSRELDLIVARNQIEFLRNRLRQVFPGREMGAIMPSLESLEQERAVFKMVAEDGELPVPQRLDTMSARHFSKQAEAQARLVKESLRPQFDAYVSYGKNGLSTDFDNAWNRATGEADAGTRVGIQFSMDLNRSRTGDRARAAKLAAEASYLQATAQDRNSQVSWDELQRRIGILKAQLLEATRLADFQMRKVEEERRRFRLGRSTVFQLVTFEIEAADAEVRKYRFMADLRKTESQVRLFTRNGEGA